MITNANSQPTAIRTERGLSVAGTRITIYSVIDYIKAGWSTKLIRDRLNLTEKQVEDVLDYVETHRQEVETEYELVLKQAKKTKVLGNQKPKTTCRKGVYIG